MPKDKKGHGARYGADPHIDDHKGPLTCDKCQGRGVVVREHKRVDSDGDAYTDYDEITCGRCNGSGQIR